MKILQLCLRVPFPANDGGTIAMYNIAESLSSAGNEVQMLCINTHKHLVNVESLPSDVREKYKLKAVEVDTSVRVIPAIQNIFGTGSYNVSRFYSSGFRDELTKLLKTEQYDAVILESLFMAPYLELIRSHTKAPVFLRSHNVEFRIWERLADSTGNLPKKSYLRFLARRLKQYELSVINRFDAILAITKDDQSLLKELGCEINTNVVPLSLDVSSYPYSDSADYEKVTAFHLGSMDWLPNIEGIDWFLEKVFPRLAVSNKHIVHLAGKSMPDRLLKLNSENLVVEGRIKDARSFMADKPIMIVPLLSGGGMRVKIIEGMAMGKAVISTSIGAEGIECTNGKDILIADDPDTFASHINKCFNEPELCLRLGRNARTLAMTSYDIHSSGKEVSAYIKTFVNRS